jgi:predicted nucleotidyltransferase
MATLTARERLALKKILQHLASACGPELASVILYGSKARGDFNDGSDIDILVLVRDRNRIDRYQIYDYLLDDDVDYDLNFSLNIYGVDEFQRLASLKAPFAINVTRDGETLWTS